MAVFTLILFNLPKFSYAEGKDNKPEVNVNIQLSYKDKPVVNTDVQFNGDTEPKININIDKDDKDKDKDVDKDVDKDDNDDKDDKDDKDDEGDNDSDDSKENSGGDDEKEYGNDSNEGNIDNIKNYEEEAENNNRDVDKDDKDDKDKDIDKDKDYRDDKDKKEKNTNVWLDNISNGFIQHISEYISRQNNIVLERKNYTINTKDKKVGDTGESGKNPVKPAKSNSKQINPVEDYDSIIIKIDYLLEKILKVKKEKITGSIGININNIEDLLDTERIIGKHHILSVIDLDEIVDLNYTSDIKTVRETGQTEKLPGFVLNIWNKFKQLIILYG